MEYILEEFSSYQKLKDAADFLFKESEGEDNKFYLIQTEHGKVGITYYNLGVKPSIILKDNILFMAFGTSIISFDVFYKKLLYKITDAMYVTYELQYNKYFNQIICICELSILAFNSKGLLLWESGVQDVITDYELEERSIRIHFDDESELALSLENGKVIPFKG